MQTMKQEEIAANAVCLYQFLNSELPGSLKRDCAEVSDASDDESVQSKRRKITKVYESNGLKPAPFFHYVDYSEEQDEDPLAPLTPPGCTANFPAKMHAMLSRKELSDIVAWLPHGRAWRVLKPKVFASEVAPAYFGLTKYPSFVRQANGWGFRRITTGRDRGAYYHDRFLRGLPHLCKKMKRPGVAEKKAVNPEHEPDLHAISEMHPLSEKASADDGLLLESTLHKVGPCILNNDAQKCSTSEECVPRSVTPLSESSRPQSPLQLPPSQASNLSNLNRSPTISIPNTSPQIPAAQGTMLPVPARCTGPAMGTPRISPPVPTLLQQSSLGSFPQLSYNTVRINPTQGVGASPQFAAGFATATAAMNSSGNCGLSLLQQALFAASCNQQPFLQKRFI